MILERARTFLCLLSGFFLFCLNFSDRAQAGDKVGNGGGIWACMQQETLQSGAFVDLYEAKNEYGYNLVVPNFNDPLQVFREREEYLRTNLPDFYSRISSSIDQVFLKLRYVESELEIVDDARFILRPLPSTCPGGQWKYVQWANFKLDNEAVLIRKDIWDNPRVGAIDKAALWWHEIIYLWIRTEFKDTVSTRARRLTGLLFSTFSPTEKQKEIERILASGGPGPIPTPSPSPTPTPVLPPPFRFVCLVEHRASMQLYMGFGESLLEAKSRTSQLCEDSGSPIHCPDPRDCSVSDPKKRFFCRMRNPGVDKTFTGYGKSLIEAQYAARSNCISSLNPYQCGWFPGSSTCEELTNWPL